jgi:hypothetical protein
MDWACLQYSFERVPLVVFLKFNNERALALSVMSGAALMNIPLGSNDNAILPALSLRDCVDATVQRK